MKKANHQDLLQQRIDEVLHYIWDPIGISDAPEARSEYGTYAAIVWRDVLEGKSKDEIAAYLTNVATEQMGLEPQQEHDNKVAEIILDWARFVK